MAIIDGTPSDGNGGNNGIVDLSNIIFTNRSDVVDKENLILIPDGSFVSTLAGNDLISSDYTTDTPTASVPNASGDLNEAVSGIYNQESLDTSSGRDEIRGDVKYTGEPSVSTYGILNRPNDGSNLAIISTGSGNDKILGFADSSNSIDIDGIGNSFSSEINTGAGRDEVKGEATGNATNLIAGISQSSSSDATNLITTGNGDDKVIGKVNNGRSDRFLKGIFQDGKNTQIITDNGNDQVIGEANGSAVFITGIDQEDGNNQITTGKGKDEIVGEASGDASGSLLGIVQGGGSNQIIITGNGNDKVIGKANGNLTVISLLTDDGQQFDPVIAGINQFGTGSQKISTGNGTDEIRGTATGTVTSNVAGLVPILGIAKSNSTIETGNSNDKVIGEASGTADQIAGIVQQDSTDVIDTGRGNDEVIGTASGTAIALAGIAQEPGTAGSQIITGEGNDKIIGTASNNIPGLTAGILGDLDILTGSGDDEVIASAKINGTRVDGFVADPFTGGAVTVDTGSGNDLVKGFGQGSFDGGEGNRDIYDLSEYSQSEFTIEIGTGGNNEVDFILGESTAFTQGFEVFLFADGELSFADLA